MRINKVGYLKRCFSFSHQSLHYMSMRISTIWFLVFIEKLRGYPLSNPQTLNSCQPFFLKLCGPYCFFFFFFWELWIWVVFLTFPLLPLSNNCFVQVLYSLEVQIKFHLSVISLACWYLWVKAVKLSLLPGRGERMTRFISGSVPLTMWHMFWRFLQDLCPRRQFLSWQCSVSCSKRWWMDELPVVSWVLILIQWLATWISLAKLLTISRLGMSFHNPSE